MAETRRGLTGERVKEMIALEETWIQNADRILPMSDYMSQLPDVEARIEAFRLALVNLETQEWLDTHHALALEEALYGGDERTGYVLVSEVQRRLRPSGATSEEKP